MFSEQYLEDFENKLLKDDGKLFVVFDQFSNKIEGIFTSKKNANEFVIKCCIAICLCGHEDYLDVCEKWNMIAFTFEQLVKTKLLNFVVINISEMLTSEKYKLKLNIPIYVLQNNIKNYPYQYLTNNLNKWKYYSKTDDEQLIKDAIVKIDRFVDYHEFYVAAVEKRKHKQLMLFPNLKKENNIITHILRTQVWNKYIGKKIGAINCPYCCVNEIAQLNFECGHVIAKVNNGTNDIDNLRPICNKCNKSLGSKTMDTEKWKTGLDKQL